MVGVTHDALYSLAKVNDALLPLMSLNFTLKGGAKRLSYPPMCRQTEPNCGNDKFQEKFSLLEFDAAKKYEKSREYLELYSQKDLDFVNSQVDAGLMGSNRRSSGSP